MPPKRKAAVQAASFIKTPSKPSPSTASGLKRRGRPSKVAAVSELKSSEDTEPTARPRGRPKGTTVATSAIKQKRGADSTAAGPPKKRGRLLGSTNGAVHDAKSTVTKEPHAKDVPRKRGRPAKDVQQGKIIQIGKETDPDLSAADQADEPSDQNAHADIQYWLMKAEPETRLEKGIDVSYPIDKLAAATEPEPWDGVRNYQARNHMRAMRKGDLAFFYHSNCDTPGIVGVMRVAEEHSVDMSAFDPSHPYFDEKSDREKPRWDCVKVEFVKKFDNMVTLKTLKTTPQLSNMQIASKSFSRLSVQTVKPNEWFFVLDLAGESASIGQDGQPTEKVKAGEADGYEAGTDGETERHEDGEA